MKAHRNIGRRQHLEGVRIDPAKLLGHGKPITEDRAATLSLIRQAVQELKARWHFLIRQIRMQGQVNRGVRQIVWVGLRDDFKCFAKVGPAQKTNAIGDGHAGLLISQAADQTQAGALCFSQPIQ